MPLLCLENCRISFNSLISIQYDIFWRIFSLPFLHSSFKSLASLFRLSVIGNNHIIVVSMLWSLRERSVDLSRGTRRFVEWKFLNRDDWERKWIMQAVNRRVNCACSRWEFALLWIDQGFDLNRMQSMSIATVEDQNSCLTLVPSCQGWLEGIFQTWGVDWQC